MSESSKTISPFEKIAATRDCCYLEDCYLEGQEQPMTIKASRFHLKRINKKSKVILIAQGNYLVI